MVKEKVAAMMEQQHGDTSTGTSQVHPIMLKTMTTNPSPDLLTHNM